MRSLRLILGLFLVMAATIALAQTGSIQGTVTDSVGAVVQGAEITVKNLGSNAVRTVTSSGTGAYSVSNLQPGSYDVTVKVASFKTFHVSDLPLTVGQVLPLNVQLEPGAVTEEVQVRADQIPDVDLETSQVSNLVDSRSIKDLPLITRNPYELVLLSPGTSQTNASGRNLGEWFARAQQQLPARRSRQQRYVGPWIRASRRRPDPPIQMPLRNFVLSPITSTPSTVATPGPLSMWSPRAAPTHSTAGLTNLGAGTLSAAHGTGLTGPRTDLRIPMCAISLGISIGGPIIKNKTFFFFNEEFQSFRTASTAVATVPTAAFKTGIFSYFGEPVDLTQAGANNGTGNAFFGDPAANAPADPTMQNVFALYPNPTIDNGDGLTGTLFYPSNSKQNSYQTVAKIDHHFTDRETVSLRYGYDGFIDPNPAAVPIFGNVSSKYT